MKTHRIGSDVTVLNDHLDVPGIGFLDVNSFVLRASEPVVIDTGLGLPDRDFVADVGSVIDPADVRWIWLRKCRTARTQRYTKPGPRYGKPCSATRPLPGVLRRQPWSFQRIKLPTSILRRKIQRR